MRASELSGEKSHFRKLAYFLIKIPWPFTAREMYLQASGFVHPEEKACILVLSSARGQEWLGLPLNYNKKNVECIVHKAFLYVKPVSETSCTLKIMMNADP